MKRLLIVMAGALLAVSVQAQVFGPSGRVAQPVFRATAPQPGSSQTPVYGATTTVVGAAVGGVLGSRSNRSGEGAALGGALGMVLGQMMDQRAQSRAARQQAQGEAAAPIVVGAAGVPQASAPELPPPPAGSFPAGSIPAIDPSTGLPLPGTTSAGGSLLRPASRPLQPANRLFGR